MKLALPLLVLGLGGAMMAGKGGKLPNLDFNPAELIPHYPSSTGEIQKAGGFWKLSLEEQAGVRAHYTEELKMLLREVDQLMRHAQYAHNGSAMFIYRQMILRLQQSVKRVQNPSCDPTAEQGTIAYVTAMLSQ